MLLIRIILPFALVAVLLGCTDKRKPNIELVQDMMKDPAVKAQDYDLEKPDKRANMLPPVGTIPMNWTPYPNFLNDEQAKDFKNPVANIQGEQAKKLLAVGQKQFQTYCAVCHGSEGYGDGTVQPVMLVKPPSLMTGKIRTWTDGQIFHLITKGRGMMGGYESQIPSQQDRWALVNYLRHLQKNQPEEKTGAKSNQ